MNVALKPVQVADRAIYVVAGGNHVTILLDRDETGHALDVIDVRADPGGGPPPHRHAFAEWFRVLEGELVLCEDREGTLRRTRVLSAGDAVFVPPYAVHGTLNLSGAPTRFQVVGQPGAMSGYFREAGVRVPDESTPPDHDPPGPAELVEISKRWGIEFWDGPVETGSARQARQR